MTKFSYVADYNARTANKELEVLMRAHVKKFEAEQGELTVKIEKDENGKMKYRVAEE